MRVCQHNVPLLLPILVQAALAQVAPLRQIVCVVHPLQRVIVEPIIVVAHHQLVVRHHQATIVLTIPILRLLHVVPPQAAIRQEVVHALRVAVIQVVVHLVLAVVVVHRAVVVAADDNVKL